MQNKEHVWNKLVIKIIFKIIDPNHYFHYIALFKKL